MRLSRRAEGGPRIAVSLSAANVRFGVMEREAGAFRAREAFLLFFIRAGGSIRTTREDPMRQVLLGLVGVMAAGAACAETYNFAAVIQGAYQEQTSIQCDGPGFLGGCQQAAS